jgi:hypothetical protein
MIEQKNDKKLSKNQVWWGCSVLEWAMFHGEKGMEEDLENYLTNQGDCLITTADQPRNTIL